MVGADAQGDSAGDERQPRDERRPVPSCHVTHTTQHGGPGRQKRPLRAANDYHLAEGDPDSPPGGVPVILIGNKST
ncbi:hypothetical protein GCM10027176_77740 [Actinoallomurus bryophytorum]